MLRLHTDPTVVRAGQEVMITANLSMQSDEDGPSKPISEAVVMLSITADHDPSLLVRLRPEPTGTSGTYAARVVFPEKGFWRVRAEAEYANRPQSALRQAALTLYVVPSPKPVSVVGPAGTADPDAGVVSMPSTGLSISEAPHPDVTRLVPLDPVTLLDRGLAADLGTPSWTWILSADGSTVIGLQYGTTIVVRDSRAGAERHRFLLPTAAIPFYLSRDGSRLMVVRSELGRAEGVQSRIWSVLNTADGRLLATVRTEGGVWEHVLVDPDVRHLYCLVIRDTLAAAPGPQPVTLVAYDLATGAEGGRSDLPSVLAGRWETDRSVHGGEPVTAQLSPGVAISPDGRRLGIVHADNEALTLVDAERLAVERTVSLTRPASFLDLLSLMPRPAEAKAFEGTTRQAVFGPDGNQLFIWGLASRFDERGNPTWRGLGLTLVDVERGQIVAKALPDERIDEVLPAADGRSVDVFGPKPTAGTISMAGSPYLLRRLDAATLATLAERELRGYRRLLVGPATR